jgi:phage replication O-like protein O
MPDRDFDPKKGGWFKFMNEFADALCKYELSKTEIRIVFRIIRKTWGHKGQAWAPIGFVDFMKNCEMSDAAVSRALRRLINERNFVQRKKVKGKYHYKINSKPSTWKYPKPYRTVSKKTITELEQKVLQNCNSSITELSVIENPTFKRKDNIKDKVKTPPIIPPSGNGDANSTKSKKALIEEQAKEVIDFLNFLSGKTFKHSEASLHYVRARLNEGYTLDELKYVCQIKWDDPDHKEKYYRPSTLFRPRNFESYINEKGTKKKLSKQMARMKDTVELFARRHHERQNPTGGR